MAAGPSGTDPRDTPPTPSITFSDDHGVPLLLTCDLDGDNENHDATNDASHETDGDIHNCDGSDGHANVDSLQYPRQGLAPGRVPLASSSRSSSTAAFLHPDSASTLRPPSPQSPTFFTMEHADHGSAGPALKNPFNFQTQVISTSPVKPVCLFSRA